MSQTALERLLELIDTEKAQYLLADLRDPEKRSPQLYNAIEKFLERHKFAISKLTPDVGILGELASALAEVPSLTDEEETRH